MDNEDRIIVENNDRQELFERLIKIETLVESLVAEFKNIKDVPEKIVRMEMTIEQQQKEIDELKTKDKEKSNWIRGICGTIIGGIIIAVIKFFVGI